MSSGAKAPKLRDAYGLIYEYKSGNIKPGSSIAPKQERLLRALAADLGLSIAGMPIAEVVPLAAQADSHWNKRTMAALSELYNLAAVGHTSKATALRAEFVSACPSKWYRDIVQSL